MTLKAILPDHSDKFLMCGVVGAFFVLDGSRLISNRAVGSCGLLL